MRRSPWLPGTTATEAAARQLDNGTPADTIRRWKRREIDLYNKIAKAEIETIRQQTAERHLEIADDAMSLEDTVIARLKGKLASGEKIDARDLTTIARNLATQTGIHTDKAVDLLGLKDKSATAVQVNINLGDMVRDMKAKGTKFYDAEGNEVDPEVIEGEGKALDA